MIFSGYRNVYSTLVWYHRVLCSRNHTILHNPSSFLPEHSTTRTCSHPRPHNRTPASATNIRCCSYCPLQLHNRQPSFDIFSLTTPLVVSLYSVRYLLCWLRLHSLHHRNSASTTNTLCCSYCLRSCTIDQPHSTTSPLSTPPVW
jgi:hypothetical protein